MANEKFQNIWAYSIAVEQFHGMEQVRVRLPVGPQKFIEFMLSENVKLVVFVPISHTEIIRETLGKAGAGKIGNYDFCSFSSRGTGRFRGNEKSNPVIGKSRKYESVEEERIEVVVPREILKEVIQKVKNVHPYEEVAFDIYSLEDFKI